MPRNNDDFHNFDKSYQAWKDAANPADKRIRELKTQLEQAKGKEDND